MQRKGSWNPRACPVDLTGKTAIVTGANTGIGKFIALDLAHRKARVILACRSQERGQAALEEIRRKSHNSNVHLQLVDTSSLRSVRDFAHRINQEEKRLDILVNNAGVSGLPKAMTSEGLELSFANQMHEKKQAKLAETIVGTLDPIGFTVVPVCFVLCKVATMVS
ncbi:UNVERIFIED_CONTAM: hypothetical protein FKN15_002424 [Acipenser sinensis]